MQDKVSIIIPCYNVADLLCRCLDSVFGQKVKTVTYEVICVDDKSTDNTLEVLSAYEKRYPEDMMVISLDENGKQGRARNVGLEYASGQYIMYVDADDMVAEGLIETLYQTMLEYQCDVAECNYKSFETEAELTVESEGKVEVYDMTDLVWKKACILRRFGKTAPWGRLYRRELLECENIFFPENITMEDIFFSEMSMLYMRRYVWIPDTYYFYYINPEGTYYSSRAVNYYMDAMQVQNWTTDLARKEGLITGYEQEWEYLHFLKAFCDPISKMLRGRAFFSYKNYLDAYCELSARYECAAENSYVQASNTPLIIFSRIVAEQLFNEKELVMMMYKFEEIE